MFGQIIGRRRGEERWNSSGERSKVKMYVKVKYQGHNIGQGQVAPLVDSWSIDGAPYRKVMN